MSSQEDFYCMYDDDKEKPNCTVQHTHDFWIGLRGSVCRECSVYIKWQRVHKDELEAMNDLREK